MAGKVITIAQQKGGSGKTMLAVNLGVQLAQAGGTVALLDTDPQGSLGRWFMTRHERLENPGLDFSTSSAWGVAYECDKLRANADFIIVDTPPKADADLRPALRAADLVLVPVAVSQLDLWATEGVLDLARREDRDVCVVLNRVRAGTRLAREITQAAGGMGAALLSAQLKNRVSYAETLGQGLGVGEMAGNRAAVVEIAALATEIGARLHGPSP